MEFTAEDGTAEGAVTDTVEGDEVADATVEVRSAEVTAEAEPADVTADAIDLPALPPPLEEAFFFDLSCPEPEPTEDTEPEESPPSREEGPFAT